MAQRIGRVRAILRGFVVLGLTSSVLVISHPAHACSCVPEDVAAWLPAADGAFVGTWQDRDVIGGGQAAVTFVVQRVVKGSLGPTAIVRTSEQGSACGLELLGPARTGLLLRLADDGVWESDLCSMVSAAALLEVGGDRPPDPDVAAVSAGWSQGSKGLMALVAVAFALLALVWFVRRRRSASGESDVT